MQTTHQTSEFSEINLAELNQIAQPFVFLHSGKDGRYSILGTNPVAITQLHSGNVLEHLEKLNQLVKVLNDQAQSTSKLPFSHGLLGFFSYDFGNQLHRIETSTLAGCPLSYWIVPSEITIWDHQTKTKHQLKHEFSTTEIKAIEELIDLEKTADETPEEIPQMTAAEYASALDTIKQAIIDGETYQVNFAQAFSKAESIDPINTFRKINKLNPSPYQALIVTESFNIISNSPELLISKEADTLTTKPIKGTTSIESDPNELLNSEKTSAELTMIVDLSRNDLAQLSQANTVKVAAYQEIQKLSHVYHTYSTITATSKPDLKLSEIIKAIIPGGSVTGCPKHRTMQIINRLEPIARGPYCGSAGFINHNLDLQLNIMIRTLWQKDQQLILHSGGGIVADSQTEAEYEETIQKASAFLEVIT